MNKDSWAFRALLFYGSRLPNHPRKWWVHNCLRARLGVDVDEEFVVVRRGVKWLLNPADFVQQDVFWLGTKNYWDVRRIQSLLEPGCVFLDVGSNFGYYAVTVAAGLRKQCRVHAFEPHPGTFERLSKHIDWNGLSGIVTPHLLGLSDRQGTAGLIERHGNSGGTRLSEEEVVGVRTPVTTLDAFTEDQRLERLDLIKIDVEGFEERVLLGGLDTLARFKPPILIEIEPIRLEVQGTDTQRVVAILIGLGYRLFTTHRRRLRSLDRIPEGPDVHFNALCLHSDSPRRPGLS